MYPHNLFGWTVPKKENLTRKLDVRAYAGKLLLSVEENDQVIYGFINHKNDPQTKLLSDRLEKDEKKNQTKARSRSPGKNNKYSGKKRKRNDSNDSNINC